MYFIFKRSDGYVGQMNSTSRDIAERELAKVPNLIFEILHESETWDEDFVDVLKRLRAESHYTH